MLAYKPESRIPPELQKQFFSQVLFAKNINKIQFTVVQMSHLRIALHSASKYQSNSQIVVLIGNSQLHTINEYKDDDKTAPYFLHEMLIPKGIFLLTISYPNINFRRLLNLLNIWIGV